MTHIHCPLPIAKECNAAFSIKRLLPKLALLLLALAAFSHSAVWNGTADTTWYTNNKSASAFTISTAEQLAGLAKLVNGAYDMGGKTITLSDDIQLNDTTANGGWRNWETSGSGLRQWTAIGTGGRPFKGTFDGNGYVISGMYINTTADYQGLFCYATNGVIRNVGVASFYVNGGDYTGGLVGRNSGAISNSYATGSVSGRDYTGGLVGRNGGTISNSYATGSVSGRDYTGGLVGYNDSKVTNSYAAGNVSGIVNGVVNVGGLVGFNSGSFSNSYWDMESSGQRRPIGGTGIAVGKTTAAMQSSGLIDTLNFGAYVLNNGDANLGALSWRHLEGEYPSLGSAPASTPPVSLFFGDGTRKIDGASIEIIPTPVPDQLYAGESLSPPLSISDAVTIAGLSANLPLIDRDDYRLLYSNNKNVGIATITVLGLGIYSGSSRQINFSVVVAKELTSVNTTISAIPSQATYTGSAIRPSGFTVTRKGDGALVQGADYEVSYGANVNAGTGTVTVTGKGSYSGSVSASFTIVKAAIKDTMFLPISAQKYSGSTVEPVPAGYFNGKALVFGTDYSAMYSDNEDEGTGFAILNGIGNFSGSVILDFPITSFGAEDLAVIWGGAGPFVYSGKEQHPSATASFNGVNYPLAVTGAINAGTHAASARLATPNVSFRLVNYEKAFEILPKPIVLSFVTPIGGFAHTGSRITPEIEAIDSNLGDTLAIGRDYSVDYGVNVDVGEGSVVITGMGNYSGVLPLKFAIASSPVPVISGGDAPAVVPPSGETLYYDMRGSLLGSRKPAKAGVYVEKMGRSAKIAVVR